MSDFFLSEHPVLLLFVLFSTSGFPQPSNKSKRADLCFCHQYLWLVAEEPSSYPRHGTSRKMGRREGAGRKKTQAGGTGSWQTPRSQLEEEFPGTEV